MTIASTASEISYAGDGVTTVFAIPFVFDTSADLRVIRTDSAGGPSVLSSGFSVGGGSGSTGTITMSTAPAVGETLTVLDDPERTQTADYTDNDSFPAAVHEAALDRNTRLTKRLYQLIKQCLRVTDGDPSRDSGVVVPSVASRKGKWLRFNASTGALEVADTVGSGTTISRSIVAEYLAPTSTAETGLGITPTDKGYPYGHPKRYGGIGDGTTDDTTAVQRAVNVASAMRITAKIKDAATSYLCTSNISVPVGASTCVDIEGDGWSSGGLKFSGAGVTTGLTFTGSSYDYAGTVRDLKIGCVSSAKRGITFTNLNHPRVVRCYISGAAGAGVKYDTTLMGTLEKTLFTGCGSATEGTVEVIASTTFRWDHSRISVGNTTVGGLLIDTTPNVVIDGGAIESCGVQIKVGSKSDASVGCVVGLISNIDLENPGNGNMYIDFGQGLSGSAYVTGWTIRNVAGYPSTTTSVPYAVRFNRCQGVTVDFGCNFGQSGAPTSTFELVGTTNLAVHIQPQRNQYATAWPWVRANSAWVKSAGPHYYYASYETPLGLNSELSISGATASVLVFATQGGFYRRLVTGNGGATTMTALTGGESGERISIRAADGNTTLTHSTVTADQFNLTGGANLLLTNGKIYDFVHNGTLWVQV